MSARTLAQSGRNSWPRGLRCLRRGGAALAVLFLLGGGCAVKQRTEPASPVPASKEQREVAELEKTIADLKAGLRSAGDDRLAADTTATPLAAGAAPSPRCDGVCRAGQEICTASRRICKIAARFDEAPLTASCQRAERSCSDASALCAQCR